MITLLWILLGIILLWFLIGSRGWWWVKMIVISIALYFAFGIQYSVESYLGWGSQASLDELPPKFLVHWAFVIEPSKTTHEEGGIHLWIRGLGVDKNESWYSMLKYQPEEKSSRYFILPYSKEKHKQVQDMMREIRKGGTFIGGKRGKGKEEKGKGGFPGREGKSEGSKGQGSFSRSNELYFERLPPPKLPPK